MILSFVVPAKIWAQGLEGQSFRIGESELTPELRIDYVTVDNAFRTAEDPVETTAVLVSPVLNWRADRRLLTVDATYSGVYGIYSESVLDFTDHNLTFRIDAAPGTRHRAFGIFTVDQEHEDLGTGQTVFNPDLPDQIVTTNVGLQTGYTFGAVGARGNVGGGLFLNSESFNDVGALTEGDDNSIVRPFGFFSYRISPDTRMLAELRYGVRDFDQDTRDRSETSFLVGLDLSATERTGGAVRLGVTNADYDTIGVSDTREFIADVNVYFRPRSYSRIDLAFNRDLDTVDDDPMGQGESVVDTFNLSWRHYWSLRFSTTAYLEREQYERKCPNIDTATNSAGLELGVNVRHWMSVGAGVTTTNRTATRCDLTEQDGIRDYDRISIGLHLTATL